jgi:hypothetical protein
MARLSALSSSFIVGCLQDQKAEQFSFRDDASGTFVTRAQAVAELELRDEAMYRDVVAREKCRTPYVAPSEAPDPHDWPQFRDMFNPI